MVDPLVIVGVATVAAFALDVAGHVATNLRLSREVMPRIDAAEERGARIEAALADLKPGALKGGHDPRELAAKAVLAREEKAIAREEGDSALLGIIADRVGGIENALAVKEATLAWLPGKWEKASENVDRWQGILGPVLARIKFKAPTDGGAGGSVGMVF